MFFSIENVTDSPVTNVDTEALKSFKTKIETDMKILRNLTYKALQESSAGSSGSLDDSLYLDLQRIQLQLQQFQTLSQKHMQKMNEFERGAKDDFQRIWDNVNELQEITNLTSKNIEDIYDKDILPLQNFKTAAENEIKKLREEMDDFLSLEHNEQGNGNATSSEETSRIINRAKKKMENLENEQLRQGKQLEKLLESQNMGMKLDDSSVSCLVQGL